MKRIIIRNPKKEIGSHPFDGELRKAFREFAEAPNPEAQQIVFERYAHCLLTNRCDELLGLLIDAYQQDAVLARAYEALQRSMRTLRQHGIDIFGPLETPNTRTYPAQGTMLPMAEQISAAMIDLVQYWELGYMKDQILPGLGDIGPFIRTRAYLVLTDRVIGSFESIAADHSQPDIARTADEIAKLLQDCRRDGIDAALRNNPQPSSPR